MAKKLSRVLLTNDDGIDAPGLKLLESMAHEIADEVWVVAPDKNCSGFGRAVTVRQEISYEQHGERRFAIGGTPTDCVFFGLNHVMRDAPPDLLLSGINLGMNVSDDIGSSGTVGAAWQAALAKIPAIALSQKFDFTKEVDTESDFDAVRHHGLPVTKALLEQGWPVGVFINVNFPSVAAGEVKGVKATRLACHTVGVDVKLGDNGGYTYHANKKRGQGAELDTDVGDLFDGYIAITPLSVDMTDDAMLNNLDGIKT